MNDAEFNAYRALKAENDRLLLLLSDSHALNLQLSQTLHFSRAYLEAHSVLTPALNSSVNHLLVQVAKETK